MKEMKANRRSMWLVCLGTVLMMVLLMGFRSHAAPVVPDKVVGLKQTNDGNKSVTVNWTSQGSGVRYEVTYSMDNRTWTDDSTYSDNNGYIVDLKPGTDYYVRVRAFYSDWNTGNSYGPYSDSLHVVTSPASAPVNFIQTAQTTTSATLSWAGQTGVTGYEVTYGLYEGYYSVAKKTVVDVSNNSIKLTGLSKDTAYRAQVRAFKRSSSGYKALSYSATVLSEVNPLPTKMTGLKNTAYYKSSSTVYFSATNNKNANGYHLQVYDGNKLIVQTTNNSMYASLSVTNSKLKTSKFYKARVRAYVNVGGAKKYGAWSDWIQFAQQSDISTSKVTKNGIKIQWKKVTGTTNYTVFASTKQQTGYKKVATTTKNNLTITKYAGKNLKKRQTYYFYVVANKKVGSKTYKSDSRYCWYRRF